MPTRQYVGARYVPKFYQNTQNPDSSEWEANQTYEALTIVTYNNGSYTSKIPVPAGIGNPAQNPTYWINTGNYNAQVEEYRQETSDLHSDYNAIKSGLDNTNENLTELNNQVNSNENYITKGTIVVLGDSWADQNTYNEYPNRVGWLHDRMNDNSKIHCYAVAGSGVSNLDAQLNNAINDESFKNGNVVTVIIICGVNDYRGNVDYVDWTTTVNNLYHKINSNMPNAMVYGMFDCQAPWSTNSTFTSHGCRDYFINVTSIGFRQVLFPYYYLGYYLLTQNCFEVPNYENSLNSFHPNALGGSIIGVVFDCLVNHSVAMCDIYISQNGAENVIGLNPSTAFTTNDTEVEETINGYELNAHIVGNSVYVREIIYTENLTGMKSLIVPVNITANNGYNSIILNTDLYNGGNGSTKTDSPMLTIQNTGLFNGTINSKEFTNCKFITYIGDPSSTSYTTISNYKNY